MKLTLRDLFWLILVVALSLGWGLTWWRIGEHRQLAQENEMWRNEHRMLRAQLEREGYTIVHSSIGPFLMRTDSLP